MKLTRKPLFLDGALLLFLLAVVLSVGGDTLEAQDFYLQTGDRVTFYGDSITAQRYYTRDIQDFVATRYPTLAVAYHNSGVPGDRVNGGYAGDAAVRVARDVKPWNPTVITVMLGMNDGGYVSPDPKIFSNFQGGYGKLLTLLRAAAPSARMTLIESTPFDEITHRGFAPGYMPTVEQNAAAIADLGKREGLPVVNDYSPIKQLLESAKAIDPLLASLLIPDQIHPSEPIHWIMAEAVLKAWQVDPVVSDVSLSASSQAVTQSRRTHVSGVSADENILRWDQLDEALPLPINLDNALMTFVLKLTDLESFDKETLRITDLKAGEYKLTIDKMDVGTFSAEQFTAGINLAQLKTPMWYQARRYDSALDRRSKLEDADFYLFAETSVKEKTEASRILREGEADFQNKAEAKLLISAHHYELAPVTQTAGGVRNDKRP